MPIPLSVPVPVPVPLVPAPLSVPVPVPLLPVPAPLFGSAPVLVPEELSELVFEMASFPLVLVERAIFVACDGGDGVAEAESIFC